MSLLTDCTVQVFDLNRVLNFLYRVIFLEAFFAVKKDVFNKKRNPKSRSPSSPKKIRRGLRMSAMLIGSGVGGVLPWFWAGWHSYFHDLFLALILQISANADENKGLDTALDVFQTILSAWMIASTFAFFVKAGNAQSSKLWYDRKMIRKINELIPAGENKIKIKETNASAMITPSVIAARAGLERPKTDLEAQMPLEFFLETNGEKVIVTLTLVEVFRMHESINNFLEELEKSEDAVDAETDAARKLRESMKTAFQTGNLKPLQRALRNCEQLMESDDDMILPAIQELFSQNGTPTRERPESTHEYSLPPRSAVQRATSQLANDRPILRFSRNDGRRESDPTEENNEVAQERSLLSARKKAWGAVPQLTFSH